MHPNSQNFDGTSFEDIYAFFMPKCMDIITADQRYRMPFIEDAVDELTYYATKMT